MNCQSGLNRRSHSLDLGNGCGQYHHASRKFASRQGFYDLWRGGGRRGRSRCMEGDRILLITADTFPGYVPDLEA